MQSFDGKSQWQHGTPSARADKQAARAYHMMAT
jgi:hypothetical protein